MQVLDTESPSSLVSVDSSTDSSDDEDMPLISYAFNQTPTKQPEPETVEFDWPLSTAPITTLEKANAYVSILFFGDFFMGTFFCLRKYEFEFFNAILSDFL